MKFIGLESNTFDSFSGPTQIPEKLFSEIPPKELEEELLLNGDFIAFDKKRPNHYKVLKKDSMGYRVIHTHTPF